MVKEYNDVRFSDNIEDLKDTIQELKRLNREDMNEIRMIQDMLKTRRIQREILEKRLKELKGD